MSGKISLNSSTGKICLDSSGLIQICCGDDEPNEPNDGNPCSVATVYFYNNPYPVRGWLRSNLIPVTGDGGYYELSYSFSRSNGMMTDGDTAIISFTLTNNTVRSLSVTNLEIAIGTLPTDPFQHLSGTLQWSGTLAPGESQSVNSTFQFNAITITDPGDRACCLGSAVVSRAEFLVVELPGEAAIPDSHDEFYTLVRYRGKMNPDPPETCITLQEDWGTVCSGSTCVEITNRPVEICRGENFSATLDGTDYDASLSPLDSCPGIAAGDPPGIGNPTFNGLVCVSASTPSGYDIVSGDFSQDVSLWGVPEPPGAGTEDLQLTATWHWPECLDYTDPLWIGVTWSRDVFTAIRYQ